MRSLTTLFEAEKNKKTGAKPVWILKCPFVSGTLYLSDRDFTYTGVTITPWIASWGSIDEDLSNQLTMPMVSDFDVDIIIDPDAATDIHDLLWSESVETIKCELYLWFEGLVVATDPMVKIWTGNIIDFEKTSELVYNVRLVDESVRLDKRPGNVLSLSDYPKAHLNDVGYQLPIIYGSVENVYALRLSMGRWEELETGITANALAIGVAGYKAGDLLLIEDEQIKVITTDGNTISVSWRGYNNDGTGTFATLSIGNASRMGMCASPNGDVYVAVYNGDIYKQTLGSGAFVALGGTSRLWRGMAAAPNGDIYAVVDSTGASVGEIYKRAGGAGAFTGIGETDRDWCAICVAPNGNIYAAELAGDIYMQTGGAGAFNALSAGAHSWRGLAACPNGDIYATDVSSYVHKRTGGAGAFVAIDTSSRAWYGICSAPNGGVFATVYGGDLYYKADGITSFSALSQTTRNWTGIAVAPNGLVSAITDGADIYASPGSAAVAHSAGSSVRPITCTGIFMFADHPVKTIDSVKIPYSEVMPSVNATNQALLPIPDSAALVDITADCTLYTGQGGANDLAGYAGKAVITTEISYLTGTILYISGEGYKDDGSGTFTGSASSLISRPDHIFKHLLYTYAAWAVADFSTDAATPFAADSYAFAVVINTRKSLKEWLAYMALQCRCWFRFAGGRAYLLYRPDSITSDKTISKFVDKDDNTTTMRIVRSPLDEIINKIKVYYQRDWTKQPGREAYQAVTSTQDITSITAYGEKEKADTFLFDFVWSATMAADIRDFYLARYKDRKKVIRGELFLDNMELEFGDGVTLTEVSSVLCEVRKVGISPGNLGKMDRVLIEAREY